MLDDTNHDLVHALSVRLDSRWHDLSYGKETKCTACRRAFERLQDLDDQAVQLLTRELAAHVKANKFPVDLTD